MYAYKLYYLTSIIAFISHSVSNTHEVERWTLKLSHAICVYGGWEWEWDWWLWHVTDAVSVVVNATAAAVAVCGCELYLLV